MMDVEEVCVIHVTAKRLVELVGMRHAMTGEGPLYKAFNTAREPVMGN